MIIVAGTIRIPADKIEALRPTAEATLLATRKEKGCIVYSYAFDVLDKGLLRIYEEWEGLAHLRGSPEAAAHGSLARQARRDRRERPQHQAFRGGRGHAALIHNPCRHCRARPRNPIS